MKNRIKPALISPETTVLQAMAVISASPAAGGPSGIALVVDEDKNLLGIMTDGDLRQLVLSGADLSEPVDKHMNREPVTLSKDLKGPDAVRGLRRAVKAKAKSGVSRAPRRLASLSKIVVVDGRRIHDVLSPFELFQSQHAHYKEICVLGLGYVGLTLAAILADEDFFVTGIDPDPAVRASLAAGQPHFHENGLAPIIKRFFGSRFLALASLEAPLGEIYIVAVGTPVDGDGVPQMDDLTSALRQIAAVLKQGDLVVLRSTVPPGTCRQVALPILEESGLKGGAGFHFVFAPERTVEGRALQELRGLPQVIGGLTPECVNTAANFFSTFVPTIVRAESLEAAEVVKLINNTFRDVSFAYANQVAMLCDRLGVDTVAAIHAANEGYVRNPVPVPSPGVGGTCLKKDPYIMMHRAKDLGLDLSLVREGREANERMPAYVAAKVTAFFQRHGLPLESKVFIVGVAFKGVPETSDIRNATSLDVIAALNAAGVTRIQVYDPVVEDDALRGAGLVPAGLEEGFDGAHAVLILNNHHSYHKFNTFSLTETMAGPGLFFDGWHMFTQGEIEAVAGIEYQGLGTRDRVFSGESHRVGTP